MTRPIPSDAARLAERFTHGDPLRVLVLTLSDRAHAGEYADRSGPLLVEHLEAFARPRGIALAVERAVLPDDPEALRTRIVETCERGDHVVFMTGGTGVGPRDCTPDVVLELADKTIPGIMEAIRLKYGAEKPLALLSRTVAAVRGTTLLYALPGSPKGVAEYMTEIVLTLEHLLVVLHGLGAHE
jgi:molybdopterin adenylyltransferase